MCISSVHNLVRTLTSSLCQLWLRVWVRLRLSNWDFNCYTRTHFHILTLITSILVKTYSHCPRYVDHYNQWPLWHSWAPSLREFISQLGTNSGSAVPNSGIVSETWPHNWVVLSSILVHSSLYILRATGLLWLVYVEKYHCIFKKAIRVGISSLEW